MAAQTHFSGSRSHGNAWFKWRKPNPAHHALLLILLLLVYGGNKVLAQEQLTFRTESLLLINKGDNHMALFNWQDALFAYDNAIAVDPSFATAYMKKPPCWLK